MTLSKCFTISIFMLLVSIAFVGCESSKDNVSGPDPEKVDLALQSTIHGRAVDVAGIAVLGAHISVFEDGKVYGEPVRVDDNGVFSLVLPADKNFSLLVKAQGFANQVVKASSPLEGEQISLSVTLISRGDTITISEPGVNTQTGSAGASVTFDRADFLSADGRPIVDDIQLSITPVDVSKSSTLAAFPGSFSGVEEGDSEPEQIISFGTVEYHFTQNGAPIHLAENKSADVLLPIYTRNYQDGSRIEVGDEIPLWSLNETTGIWQQEGVGDVVSSPDSLMGLAMQATVTHFSWWNVDVPADVARVQITVLGESQSGATIIGRLQEDELFGWGLASTSVRVGGTVRRIIPAGTEICFSANIAYASGERAGTEEQCITAASGDIEEVTLVAPVAGELALAIRPSANNPKKVSVHTVVYQPKLVSIVPISAETSVSYAITSGSLPNGLSLGEFNSVAIIVGEPQAVGTYDITVTAIDEEGYQDSVEISYVVTSNDTGEFDGLWLWTYEEEWYSDPIGYMVYSIKDNVVTEYDCVPVGGFEPTGKHTRLIVDGEIEYVRTAIDGFFDDMKETYQVLDGKLYLVVELRDENEVYLDEYEFIKLDALPSNCNDNTIKLSNVTPTEIIAGTNPTITFDYQYKFVSSRIDEYQVSLGLDLITIGVEGNTPDYYEAHYNNGLVMNNSPVTDGSVASGSFTYTFDLEQGVTGHILHVVPSVSYRALNTTYYDYVSSYFVEIPIVQP